MKKLLFILTLFVMVFPANLCAQLTTEQGVGQVIFKGWGSPNTKARQEAIRKAKLNALIRYTAKFDQAKAMNYEKIKSTVEAEIDKFVPDYNIIDEDVDKKAKLLRIAIQASINSRAIDIELHKVSSTHGESVKEQSYIAIVFVAREAKAVKKFKERKTEISTEDSSGDVTESTTAEEGDLSFSSESSRDLRKTTGGSSVQKADQVKWDVSSANEINTAMNNIFSTAGFEVVDADYLSDGLVSVEEFIDDYKYGDRISGSTKRDAVAGLRSEGIQYFAIGTLDVGMKDVDPVSGLTRVFVSVTGKILSLKKKFPKTVASVGPIQFSGLGPDQRVAKINALTLAAKKAAKEMTSQLRAKGIK